MLPDLSHALSHTLSLVPFQTLGETAPTGIVWFYVAFITMVLMFLALDLGVFHRTAHVVSVKEAATWSAIWTACALSFTAFVYYGYEAHWLGLGLNVPVVGEPPAPVVKATSEG